MGLAQDDSAHSISLPELLVDHVPDASGREAAQPCFKPTSLGVGALSEQVMQEESSALVTRYQIPRWMPELAGRALAWLSLKSIK